MSKLIEELHTLLGLQAHDVGDAQADCSFEVEGVSVAVLPQEEPFACVCLYADLGPMPLTSRTQVMQAMLEANWAWVASKGSTFAVDSGTDVACLAQRIPSHELTALQLLEGIKAFASVAADWSDMLHAQSLKGELTPQSNRASDVAADTYRQQLTESQERVQAAMFNQRN